MISKLDTRDIRREVRPVGMGTGESRSERRGAKIETHRGERYKWDVVPRTRRDDDDDYEEEEAEEDEKEDEPTKKCIEITERLEEAQEEGGCRCTRQQRTRQCSPFTRLERRSSFLSNLSTFVLCNMPSAKHSWLPSRSFF